MVRSNKLLPTTDVKFIGLSLDDDRRRMDEKMLEELLEEAIMETLAKKSSKVSKALPV